MTGNVYFYELYGSNGLGKRNNEKDFMQKEVKLTSVVNVPGRPYEMFCVGRDRKISSNIKLKSDKALTNGADNASGGAEWDMNVKIPRIIS